MQFLFLKSIVTSKLLFRIINNWFKYAFVIIISAPGGYLLAANKNNIYVVQPAYREVTLTGFTRPNSILPLAFEMPGKVADVYINVGEKLPKKKKFACLDRTFINLDLKKNLSEQSRLQVVIKFINKEVNRYKKLVQKQAVSPVQLEKFLREKDLEESQLRILKIEYQRLQQLRKRHCITVNSNRVLIKRLIESGQWVDTGQIVGELGDFQHLLIPFSLSYQEYHTLLKKTLIEVSLPEIQYKLKGALVHISPDYNQTSRKISLDVKISALSEKIRGGLRAQIILNLPEHDDVFLLHKDAVKKRYEESWVKAEKGREFRVTIIGSKIERQDSLLRISSPQIQKGDRFLSWRKDNL